MKNIDIKIESYEDDEQTLEYSTQINKTLNLKSSIYDKKRKKLKIEKVIEQQNNIIQFIPFEEQELIEFILMDFKNSLELNKFRNMTSLSLIQQNINSLEVNEYKLNS